jgi:AmiR/NasT family two-component response regulator
VVSLAPSDGASFGALNVADVVHFITDMLFASKVREVAKTIGLTVQGARDPQALATAAREAKLVIVDLRVPRALEALDALAADATARAVPSVAFIDHERTDLMDAARAKGAGQVMAKGQFANALPKLLQAALGPTPPAAA